MERLRSILVGFLGAGIVFAVLFWVVGVNRILDALGRADLGLVAVVGLLMASWLVMQGLALRVVAGTLGIDLRPLTAVIVFAGGAFANNVTPFGQAGGEPITALLLAEEGTTEYENALAAIASADVIDFFPSTTLALLGIGYVATTAALGPKLEIAALAVGGFSVVLAIAGTVLWRRQAAVERAIVRIVTPAFEILSSRSPFPVPGPDRIETGVEAFFVAVGRVATNPRRLALALGYSTAGLVVQGIAMWLTFRALGTSIPIAVPFFVIPVGTMAAVGPLPGGLGGIEAVHIVLLATTTTVTVPVVTAAVVIHRLGGFWITMTLGGGSMALLGRRTWLT